MKTNRCKLCNEFYQKYPLSSDGKHVLSREDNFESTSDPIKCAFSSKDGLFSNNNWCCETASKLRELVEYNDRDDNRSASIGVLRIPEHNSDADDNDGIQQGYIVASWYKDRGKTGQMWVMWDDDEPQRLNLKTVEFVLSSKMLR